MATLASPVLAQTPAADRRIDITVLDEQGLAVVGARVTATLRAGNLSRTVSSSNERFSLVDLAPGAYTLRVSASGFQVQDVAVDLTTEMTQTVEVRLRPAGYAEQLVVTATRSEQLITDVPASVNIVSNEQIERSPAVVADDVLRQVPTFSLFRRTSSIAANPTAQGVSLRGIGPSGVSRTLVLLDDVPFNDPFGGWVYWTRVPMMNAERIEIIDGATSSLYGNYAMGGVINIVTNRPTPRSLIFKPQYGNRSTPKMDLFASDVWGKVGVTFDATSSADRWLRDCGRRRARDDRQRSERRVSELQRETRLQPDRSREPVLPRGRVRRGTQQRQDRRGQRHELEVRQRRRAAEVRGRQQRRGARVLRQRRLLPEHVRGAGRDAAAQPEQSVAREDGADQCLRIDGAVVASVPARLALARRVGRNRFPVDRRRQRRADVRARDRDDAAHPSRGRRHAAVRRRVRAGSDRGDAEAAVDAERARRQLAQLRRPQSRDDDRDRSADGRESRVAARQVRYDRQPAIGRALSRDRPRIGVGELQQGFSRADAQGAVQPVPRRTGADAGERDAGPRAADRRGTRRQRRGDRTA